MNTRTFEFDYKTYLVEVEATRDGEVIEAKISVDHMEPTDCTRQFKESSWCMEELQKKIDETDNEFWGEGDDDWALETLKEALRPA